MSKGFASNYRIVLLAAALLASFSVLGTRLVYLHVIDREALLKRVEQVRQVRTVQEARRGDILDARNNKLATSRPVVQVCVDPSVLRPSDESKWPQLAALLGRPFPEVDAILRKRTERVAPVASPTASTFGLIAPGSQPSQPTGFPDASASNPAVPALRVKRWAELAEDVDEKVFEKIQALGIHGVFGNPGYRRTYPQNQLAAHLVGYVNKENVPSAGIEAYANSYLRGMNGWRISERDGRGREIAQFRTREVAPNDGYSVVLSIDSAVQFMIENELSRIVRDFNPAGATIIVSDARSGFLLGLGNYPTFNLNEYNLAAAGSLESLKNIALTNQIEPGSTFKIVAAAGALNEGLVTPDTRFNCSLLTIPYLGRTRKFMGDSHTADHPLTVAEIISRSSNVGAAQIGMKLGDRKLYDYARAFGFGERSGFPFGGEISGMLNAPEKWTADDITHIPAGYSVAATPLQIHYAMGVIASGGLLLQPQVIREIRDPAGETVQRFDTVVKRRVVAEQTAATMAQLLMGVVSPGGTAVEAAIEYTKVAGKTGTAQKLINGTYSNKNHVGSFVGFFPARRPEVVITVIVDDARVPPGETAYGAKVAAPAFKHLAEQLYQYLDIKSVPTAGPLVARQGGLQ